MTTEPEPKRPARPRKPRASTPDGARRMYRDVALNEGRGFTPDKQAEYLAALARGLRRSKAAALASVNYATVTAYRKKDPAFAAAEAEAEAQACEAIEDALWETAAGGHMTAMMFWLQNRAPDRWKDMRRVTKEVTHSGTVAHALEAGPSIDRILALQAQLQERKALRAGDDPNVIDVEPLD